MGYGWESCKKQVGKAKRIPTFVNNRRKCAAKLIAARCAGDYDGRDAPLRGFPDLCELVRGETSPLLKK
jgi:hypothetical protein